MTKVFTTLLALAVPAVGWAAPAAPGAKPGCHSSRMINTSGQYLRLNTGEFFRLYPGSQVTTPNWLPQDRISYCRITGVQYELTNLDRKDSVKGIRQN